MKNNKLLSITLSTVAVLMLNACGGNGEDGAEHYENLLDAAAEVTVTSAPPITLANENAYPISGTCTTDAGDVTISIENAVPETQDIECSEEGTWDATFDFSNISDDTEELSINVTQGNASGNAEAELDIEIDKDTVAPVVETTSAPVITSSNQSVYPVSGICTASDGEVTVSIDGATPETQGVECSEDGTWNATFDLSDIADDSDTLNVKASQIDTAGNPSAIVPVEIEQDTIAPEVAITPVPLVTPENMTTYPVNGSCTAGDGDVTVSIAGATPSTQDVTCSDTGTWSAIFNVTDTPDGNVEASQKDEAGNTGTATPVPFSGYADTTAPEVAITPVPEVTEDNQETYPVSGSCTAGDGDVTVSIAGATPSTQAVECSDAGTWSAIFNVTDIPNGIDAVVVEANQTDEEGNRGTATPVSTDKDVAVVEIPSNAGKVFHIAFTSNYTQTAALKLYISSSEDTNVTINVPTFDPIIETISANESKEVIIDSSMMLDGIEIANKVIEVIADQNIIVVGMNLISASSDAFLALPDTILSNEYRTATYEPLGSDYPEEFSIVAIEDNTTVTYELMDGVTTETITLNKGEAYQYQGATVSLTGAYIYGDKNFAVHSGNTCTNIPNDQRACDHIVEQMLPLNTWEKEFITVPLKTRLNGDTFRIVASVDNTEVEVNGVVVATLDAGAYHEMIIDGSSFIKGSQPILVLQYSNGTNYDGVISDPFMSIVPATTQYDTKHMIQTPEGFTDYVNISIPTVNIGDVIFDDVAIDSSEFTEVAGNTAFSTAQIQIVPGAHILSSSAAFGLSGYGFANAESYGYPSSLKLTKH